MVADRSQHGFTIFPDDIVPVWTVSGGEGVGCEWCGGEGVDCEWCGDGGRRGGCGL